jgi:hypothetical protein
MGHVRRDEETLADLDELIAEITTDAYGDDEKLWAFRQAFEDDVRLPADGFVIGEPVSVSQGVRFLIEGVRAGKAWKKTETSGDACEGSKLTIAVATAIRRGGDTCTAPSSDSWSSPFSTACARVARRAGHAH